MEEDHTSTEQLTTLLDQHFPLDRFSPEDRLNVLLFCLRVQGSLQVRWGSMMRMHFPVNIAHSLLNGQVHALRAEKNRKRGWALLKVLIHSGSYRNVQQQLDLITAVKNEYGRLHDERTPIGVGDLDDRGYRVTGLRATPSLEEASDPTKVNSFPELLDALKALRGSSGTPTWRDMSDRSKIKGHGGGRGARGDMFVPQPRSHSALQRTIQPGNRPSLPSVLAFVRACGAVTEEVESAWAQAHARATLDFERKSARGPGEVS
ncbi:hypothetical protein ACFWTE_19610 [Nocardiopsis sp. NPDC058631]|uniref:hypothetical protein n=1 Tax=Nocardiopsis sp. NPDC058631 TaxID=3346566 RepID=UPI00364BDB9A